MRKKGEERQAFAYRNLIGMLAADATQLSHGLLLLVIESVQTNSQALTLDRLGGEHLLERIVLLRLLIERIGQEVRLLENGREQIAKLLHVHVEESAHLRIHILARHQGLTERMDAAMAHYAMVSDALCNCISGQLSKVSR